MVSKASTYLFAIAVISSMGGVVYAYVNDIDMSDCDVLLAWHGGGTRQSVGDFETFVNEYGRVTSLNPKTSGFWDRSHFEIAVHFPDQGDFELRVFRIDRSGKLYDGASMSISMDGWKSYEKSQCPPSSFE